MPLLSGLGRFILSITSAFHFLICQIERSRDLILVLYSATIHFVLIPKFRVFVIPTKEESHPLLTLFAIIIFFSIVKKSNHVKTTSSLYIFNWMWLLRTWHSLPFWIVIGKDKTPSLSPDCSGNPFYSPRRIKRLQRKAGRIFLKALHFLLLKLSKTSIFTHINTKREEWTTQREMRPNFNVFFRRTFVPSNWNNRNYENNTNTYYRI